MAERKAEGEAKQKEAAARQREAKNSFESVAREWWKWWLIGKSPRHADTTMRRMEADVFPAYGYKSINEVTAADVRQLMIGVESGMLGTLLNVFTRRHRRFFASLSLATLQLGTRPQISSRETSWQKPRLRTVLAWTPGRYRNCS